MVRFGRVFWFMLSVGQGCMALGSRSYRGRPSQTVPTVALFGLMPSAYEDSSMVRRSSYLANKNGFDYICTLIEIVCLPVLIFTYSHVENALFFALD